MKSNSGQVTSSPSLTKPRSVDGMMSPRREEAVPGPYRTTPNLNGLDTRSGQGEKPQISPNSSFASTNMSRAVGVTDVKPMRGRGGAASSPRGRGAPSKTSLGRSQPIERTVAASKSSSSIPINRAHGLSNEYQTFGSPMSPPYSSAKTSLSASFSDTQHSLQQPFLPDPLTLPPAPPPPTNTNPKRPLRTAGEKPSKSQPALSSSVPSNTKLSGPSDPLNGIIEPFKEVE